MRVFGLVGHPGGGKTGLMLRLIPLLTGAGLSVSTLRQAPPTFEPDKPGKDSFRHREAGAAEVVLASGRRWAVMAETGNAPPPGLDELLARMAPVDLVLVEGFADGPHPRLEVWRPGLPPPLCLNDPRIAALVAPQAATTVMVPRAVPVLDPADPAAIVALLRERIGI